jgi:hypothetical protein
MATDSVMGLFADPQQIQQAQQQAALQRGIDLAQLDPFQRASAQLYQGGYMAGGAIGSALGAEDPQLKMAAARRQIMQGVDQTDPQSLAQAAQALNQAGDVQGARALAMAAQEAAFKQSQITKNLREGRAAQTKLNEVGVAEGTREPVYSYMTPDGQGGTTVSQVVFKNVDGKQQMVPYTGGVDRTTAKTNVGVKLPEGESEFVKRLGVKDADRVDAAISTRDTAVSSLNSLNKLATLPADQLISGQFASGRVGATNLLSTLGLASPTDVNKLNKSQEYQKVAGDVILQTLGGKLGSGFSNADRDFIASLVPQLETSPEARRQLIGFMQNKNQEIVQETLRLEDYARKNKGLSGYTPKIPLSVEPSKPTASPASGLTDAQLKAIAGIK